MVPSSWILWCLVGLLQSTQVFGVYNPLVSVHRNTLTTTDRPLVTRQRRSFDMTRVHREPISVDAAIALRGGGIGSMVSDFNDYIGASKARSWAVLAFSVLFDTVSVALLKTAQAKSSQKQAIQTIAISFFGFFLRRVLSTGPHCVYGLVAVPNEKFSQFLFLLSTLKCSLAGFTLALKTIDVSIAYAVSCYHCI